MTVEGVMSTEVIEETFAEEVILDTDAAPILLPNVELGPEQLQRIVEGALMAARKPLTVEDIAALFDDSNRPDNDTIRAALTAIAEQCAGRGFELREVASGFRFQVVQEVAPWIARMWEEKPQRYSRALLETLALIAYRQPITRGDIEDIRGVAVASNIIKTLLEREWVRVVGHKDVPGRPALYATTRKFLDYFNLNNLDDLPTLAEIRDLDTMNAELALEGIDTVIVAEQSETGVGETEQAEIIESVEVTNIDEAADINEAAEINEIVEGGDIIENSDIVESIELIERSEMIEVADTGTAETAKTLDVAPAASELADGGESS